MEGIEDVWRKRARIDDAGDAIDWIGGWWDGRFPLGRASITCRNDSAGVGFADAIAGHGGTVEHPV